MPGARSLALAALTAALVLIAGCARATYAGGDAATIDAGRDAATDGGIDAPIDASAQCSQQPCSILPQCGCAQLPATPVCDLDLTMVATGGTRCRADNFHGTETTVCTMATTCAAEHVCVGRCRRYCNNDDECAGAGGLCIIHLTFGNPPMNIPGTTTTTCTTDCVPTSTTNATCPATWACHIYREASGLQRYLTDCDPTPQTGGNVGLPCMTNRDCRPGLDCITLNGTSNQCRPTCICPGGQCAQGSCPGGSGSCNALTTPATIGPITYGSCF